MHAFRYSILLTDVHRHPVCTGQASPLVFRPRTPKVPAVPVPVLYLTYFEESGFRVGSAVIRHDRPDVPFLSLDLTALELLFALRNLLLGFVLLHLRQCFGDRPSAPSRQQASDRDRFAQMRAIPTRHLLRFQPLWRPRAVSWRRCQRTSD